MVRPRAPRPRLRFAPGLCPRAPNFKHHDVHPGAHEFGPLGGHRGCQERVLPVRPHDQVPGSR
eukprot:406391-Pyramimonas_sp.AAC.1